jgi:dihydropteroate synthase
MKKDRRIDIMGILNLTGDSYFAESRCPDVRSALVRTERLLSEGADIIDLGACSTRPGSLPVGASEEWRRLEPVLVAIRREFPDAYLSIDTYWSQVVRNAYDLIGNFIVNDISSGAQDSGMLSVVGELGLPYVAMHSSGIHDGIHSQSVSGNIVTAVISFFDEFSRKASEAGIKEWVLDPGFGFSKTLDQNWELFASLDKVAHVFHDHRILVGVSRKSMIYKPLGISPEESLPATQAVHFAALQRGADILRVHDVAEAVQTVAIYRKSM